MVSINYATREVTCKIVYYGPGLSGKTTNLQYIHDKVPSGTRGKMISLATEADRTLYFDFLPINIGNISGLAAKFQLYTVPGQVYYNATRKLVLRGADGLVFVADSQADKMDENIESLNNMKENLAEYGYDINEIPIVIQYNKRDLPNVLSVSELNSRLNTYNWKSFEAEAVTGKGVFDTLKMSIKMVLDKARKSRSATVKAQPIVASPVTANAPVMQPSLVEARADDSQPVRQPVYHAEAGDDLSMESTAREGGAVEYNTLKEEPSEMVESSSIDSPSEVTASSSNGEAEAVMEDENWGQNRPFPGSASRLGRRVRRITVSDFQPTGKTDEEPVMEDRFRRDETGYSTESDANLPMPKMAPSNRLIKKKHGFFKRLFGIK